MAGLDKKYVLFISVLVCLFNLHSADSIESRLAVLEEFQEDLRDQILDVQQKTDIVLNRTGADGCCKAVNQTAGGNGTTIADLADQISRLAVQLESQQETLNEVFLQAKENKNKSLQLLKTIEFQQRTLDFALNQTDENRIKTSDLSREVTKQDSVLFHLFETMGWDLSPWYNYETTTSAETTTLTTTTRTTTTEEYDHDVCKTGWKYQGDYCIFYSSVEMNWHDANDYCLREGSKLAEPESRKAMRTLTDQLPRARDRWWLGASDLHDEGVWMWEDSRRPMADLEWSAGEPNNKNGNEHCVEIIFDSLLNDQNCEYLAYPICMADPMGTSTS